MSLEENLRTATTKIAGGQIYDAQAPEKITDNLVTPLVVYHMVSGAPNITQTSFVRNPRYRFDIYGRTKKEILAAQEDIIAAIDHKMGLGFSATFIGEQDVQEPETRLFHRFLEFSVWEQT